MKEGQRTRAGRPGLSGGQASDDTGFHGVPPASLLLFRSCIGFIESDNADSCTRFYYEPTPADRNVFCPRIG